MTLSVPIAEDPELTAFRATLRGGSWYLGPRPSRTADRRLSRPTRAVGDIGFRVVCLPQEAKPAPVVSRGGAWCNYFPPMSSSAWKMRSKARHYCRAHRADDIDGFRVVCLPREVSTARCDLPLRGGSWDDSPGDCRSAYRCLNHPGWYGDADDCIGFRVVCLPREAAPTAKQYQRIHRAADLLSQAVAQDP
jgi:formylglycine-generating enzyme required for sulfatase activity